MRRTWVSDASRSPSVAAPAATQSAENRLLTHLTAQRSAVDLAWLSI